MKSSLLALRWLAMLLLLIFGSSVTYGQTNNGQLAGNVLDPSGASIPNVKITAKSQDTGSVYDAVSTGNGSYRFPSIKLGLYTLTATAPGFKSSVIAGVEVQIATVAALDITLSLGDVNETVTVNDSAPQVETQSSEVGGTISTRDIVDLPLALGGVGAMRSAEGFVFLIPGTAGPGTANSNNGIFVSKIGGGQNFGAEVLLDGASTTRSENGSSFDEEGPSVEAFSEFKVTTSTPAAEYGRTTGGVENFAIKSGSNNFHGTGYDIFRNEALDANGWFSNGNKAYYNSVGNPTRAATYKRPSDKQNDFGGTFGGPFSIPHFYNGKDRTFFFFAWEQYRRSAGGTATSTVPTLAERAGNFADRFVLGNNGQPQATGQINPCDGTAILQGQIFDPSTTRTVNGQQCRTAFANNAIPSASFSPVSQKLLALYPLPTSPALGGNYSLQSSSPVNNTTYTIRIDQNVGSRDKIFGSYDTRQNTRNNPPNRTFPGIADPDTQTQNFITHFGRAGWDHIFSATLLNHLNLGYNRSNSINGSFAAVSGINYAALLGIANIPSGLPRINTDGYTSLSRNQSDDNIDNGIRVNDSIDLQKGRNSFKVGVDYRYQQYSPISQGNTNGNFHFDGNQTKASFNPTISGATGFGGASLLLGNFDSAGVTIPFHQPRWLSSYYAAFIQDDFKVNNQLVLNLGLRYDVDQPRKEAGNNTSNFSETAIDPKSNTPGALVFGTQCHCNTRWANTWYKDIAPRIGFAYSPSSWNQKLSVRGGFAVLYAPLQYSDFGGDTLSGYTNPINQNTDGFTASYKIDNGLNPYTVGTNLNPALFDTGNSAAPRPFGNFIKPSYGRPGMVNQWNLQVQQEITKDLIMTIGYIGSSGAHLKSQAENINNTSPSTFALGDVLNNTYANSVAVAPHALPYPTFNPSARYFQALRPFPQYDFIATDCCLQNVGHSSYQALIASVERRMRQGLTAKVSYTFSKTITNADSLLNVTNGVAQEQNATDAKQQKFISNQDIPHTVVSSFLYELPFGKGQHFGAGGNRFVRSAISGFEVGGVLRYQSGQPVSLGCADGIPGYQNCIQFSRVPGSKLISKARSSHIDPFRQLRMGGGNIGPDPSVDSEYNGLLYPSNVAGVSNNGKYAALQTAPALFSQNAPDNRRLRSTSSAQNGGYLFGTNPRVTSEVRNYLYNNEDFSFLKKTPLGEGVLFILKVELLNAFNRHVFGSPDPNPYDSMFGVPTFTIDTPRLIQLTARVQF